MEWYVYFSLFAIVYCDNKTVSTQEKQDLNRVTQHNTSSIEHFTTNISLPSEGGTLLSSTPEIIQKNKQLSTLLALDGELDKHKETSVHPRKGVGNYTEDNNKDIYATQLQNTSVTLNSEGGKIEPPVHTLDFDKNNTQNISNSTNSTEVPKKPLILSYEALSNADKLNKNQTRLPIMNSSSKSLPNLTKNQIPSPNDGDVVKFYPTRANSHPGMIMPVVITILVVPMFAIFGYMALKRGQEAWKNRHYKRMDFLLDGMYND